MIDRYEVDNLLLGNLVTKNPNGGFFQSYKEGPNVFYKKNEERYIEIICEEEYEVTPSYRKNFKIAKEKDLNTFGKTYIEPIVNFKVTDFLDEKEKIEYELCKDVNISYSLSKQRVKQLVYDLIIAENKQIEQEKELQREYEEKELQRQHKEKEIVYVKRF